MSEFEKLKTPGNTFYNMGTRLMQKPTAAIEKFSRALEHYYKALEKAVSSEEISSIKKNIGMANFQLALLTCMRYEAMGATDEHEKLKEEMIFYAKQSLKHLFSALESGAKRPLCWRNRLMESINLVCDQLMVMVEVVANLNERTAVSYAFVSLMKFPKRKGQYYSQIASGILKLSVVALDNSNYTRCLAYAKDMNYPLSEAERLLPRESPELEELRKQAMFQQASAESMLIINRAQGHLDTAVKQSEQLDMDMVYEALDMFKSAALLARETVLEHEAIACYYQGRILDKILKRTGDAQGLYHRAVQLAMAIHPRVFTGEDWFNECTTRLGEIQLETRAKEDREKPDEGELRVELEKELNEIEAARTTGGAKELLRVIYKQYPPKDPTDSTLTLKDVTSIGWDKQSDDDSKIRILRRVSRDYSPDKVNEIHGAKWLFLVQEIEKHVNAVYEVVKEEKAKNARETEKKFGSRDTKAQ